MATRAQILRAATGVLTGLALLAGVVAAAERKGVQLRFSLNDPASATKDDPVTVTASGRVTDTRTGQPIAGASVRGWLAVWRLARDSATAADPEFFARCPYQETTTDAAGRYSLSFVSPLTAGGSYKDILNITVTAVGYETRPLDRGAEVTRDKTTFANLDFAMKVGKCLTGKVVDEQGRPIAGAVVEAMNNHNGDWMHFGGLGRTTTDPAGAFKLWVCTDVKQVGNIGWVRIVKSDYGVVYCTQVMDKDALGTITLPKGGTVTGHVRDADGNPLAGVEVVACGKTFVRSVTDQQGYYELKGLPGQDVITRWIKGWDPKRDVRPELTVYARTQAGEALPKCPHYEIVARDGQTIAGADFVIGGNPGVVWPAGTGQYRVSGGLVPSGDTFGVKDLVITLDGEWSRNVRADAEGRFIFPGLSPGKHRLTAYFPWNLRGQRGVGHVDIDVQAGKDLNVEIPLEPMALARVQVLDAQGNPLKDIGIGAVGTTSEWINTAGSYTDKDGRGTVYLYPNVPQKVSAYQASRKIFAEGFELVTPQPNQVIENLRIVMVPSCALRGQVASPVSLEGKHAFGAAIDSAGHKEGGRLELDDAGRFTLRSIPPGKLRFEVTVPSYEQENPVALKGSVNLDLKPGEDKDIGTITLQPVAAKAQSPASQE